MRCVEANLLVMLAGLNRGFAVGLVREFDRGGRSMQVLSEERAENRARGNESVGVEFSPETRCTETLVVGQDTLTQSVLQVCPTQPGPPYVHVDAPQVKVRRPWQPRLRLTHWYVASHADA